MTIGNRTIRKRDNTVTDYNPAKIRRALFLCFHSVGGMESAVAETHVDAITAAVENTLTGMKSTCPGVEDVQRLVIQQLWARGLFDAAEHYQNYREQRRLARVTAAPSPAVATRVLADQKHFPTDLQYYQFMSKFSRWRETDKRRETWHETVYERVTPWMFALPGAVLTSVEKTNMERAMFNLEASPAMRVVQMAGPALDRCHVGAYNCAYHPLCDLRSFAELLYILMQGTGAGFSVESEYVSQLPRIKRQNGLPPIPLKCLDTTESWCDTFLRHLELLWDGYDTIIDDSEIRPAGTRLLTKGGRASGPEPFRELITFSRNLIKSRAGRYLEDIDAHDLGCMVGRIVQVGGVRRAAEISLSDLDSNAMRHAKHGNWWVSNVQRSMANNSAVYDFETVPVETFMEEWLSLVKSKSGERGIFNRRAALAFRPDRRAAARFGCNPCAEIILRPFEFCNLSIAIARPNDTPATLREKVRTAAYFGKVQSLATNFRYIRPEWAINCREERLLGVDITGHAECPLLHHKHPGRAQLLRVLNNEVQLVDRMLSERWGINRSAASTTVKPSGDSAVFFNCGSGVSPWYAKHQIRWVRESKTSPVARFLIDSGVRYADAPEAPDKMYVFAFPRSAPDNATLRNDVTAIEQLENWLEWKLNWAEHSVSATIYVDDHEWPAVGAWVFAHIDQITGLSFLPRDNGTYTYAPNEELTAEQYAEMVANFPVLDWATVPNYETEDMTTTSQEFACVGGGC